MGSLDFDAEEAREEEEIVESDEEGEEESGESDSEGILEAWAGQKKRAAGVKKLPSSSTSSAFSKPKSAVKQVKGRQSSSSKQSKATLEPQEFPDCLYDSDGEYVHPL